jgi:hypothetical protein
MQRKSLWNTRLHYRVKSIQITAVCYAQQTDSLAPYRIATASNRVATASNRVAITDNRVATADDRVATTDDRVATADYRVATYCRVLTHVRFS